MNKEDIHELYMRLWEWGEEHSISSHEYAIFHTHCLSAALAQLADPEYNLEVIIEHLKRLLPQDVALFERHKASEASLKNKAGLKDF